MRGHNNNPTHIAFKSALRRLITKQAVVSSKSSNSLDCESTSSIFALKWSKRSAPVPSVEVEIPSDLSEKLSSLESSSYLKDNILTYVSGYIAHGMMGRVSCANCAVHLVSECLSATHTSDHPYHARQCDRGLLQASQNCGGLINASEHVFKFYKDAKQCVQRT
jgi:glycerol dehydrogenase-like iron-containing ADH family enzyme